MLDRISIRTRRGLRRANADDCKRKIPGAPEGEQGSWIPRSTRELYLEAGMRRRAREGPRSGDDDCIFWRYRHLEAGKYESIKADHKVEPVAHMALDTELRFV